MRHLEEECLHCGGLGYEEVQQGYRVYGSGYGDCEPTWSTRDCSACHGSGKCELEEYAVRHTPEYSLNPFEGMDEFPF